MKDAIEDLKKMVLIRQFEMRAEAEYQKGRIGGFFHSSSGQEAINVAAFRTFKNEPWWITSYRCHATAMVTGATPDEMMAELFGKATGNDMGRGGSMHLYSERTLGGFGIVGGQIPIATGAAFSIKYLDQKSFAICFLGDGAVAQGTLYESLNLASLWDLPCLYIIENNHWGMGTAVERAIAFKPLGEKLANLFSIESLYVNGFDYWELCENFKKAKDLLLEKKRPIIMEIDVERFKGHSISDPGLYRTKEEMQKILKKDPIDRLKNDLIEKKALDEKRFSEIEKEQRKIVLDAISFAENSIEPDPCILEEGVLEI